MIGSLISSNWKESDGKGKMIPKIVTYNSLIHSSAWKKVGLWVGKEKCDKWAGGLWENSNIFTKKTNHLNNLQECFTNTE